MSDGWDERARAGAGGRRGRVLQALPGGGQGRVLPHDSAAEIAVLGEMLLEPETVGPLAESLLTAEDFYSPAHGVIFDSMLAVLRRGEHLDVLTLAAELRARERLQTVGGAQYLGEITESMPTVAHAESHIALVAGSARQRRVIVAAEMIALRGYQGGMSAAEFVQESTGQIERAAETRGGGKGLLTMDDVVARSLANLETTLERREQNGNAIAGTTWGLRSLDRLTQGLHGAQLIILAARPAMGKCLAADCELVLSDGSVTTIEAIYRARAAELLTLGTNYEFSLTRPSDFIDDGVKPVFRVTTALGRVVETTLTHPFLTMEGWRPLGEIKVGTHVAVPRILPVFGDKPMRECEIKLLAYFIGDGCLGHSTVRFTKTDPRVLADFTEAAESFGGVTASYEKASGGRAPTLRVTSKTPKVTRFNSNPVMKWLRDVGLWGCGAATKFVPEGIFTLPKPQLALFLNRLFATDGWASTAKTGCVQVGYGSVSERLAKQVQHLLLRFGVIASLMKKLVRYKGERRPFWQVLVTHSESVRTFATEIGIFGKEAALSRCVDAIANRVPHSNTDLVPVEVWRRLDALRGEESWASLARRAGLGGTTNIHAGRRALSRRRLGLLAAALGSKELSDLATSEVYWDAVESIEFVGMKQVYDLTIPETHNFVSNDICVHNTSAALGMSLAAAKSTGAPVLVYSLEMSTTELGARALCMEARVDASRVKAGLLSQDDMTAITRAANALASVPLMICDEAITRVSEIRAAARKVKAKHGLTAIVIDYLQILTADLPADSREKEIADISRALKVLAKELEVPVIALAQLNRSCETRPGKNKRPNLSDLRESGSIEQDADVVVFIYRDEVYNKETEDRGIAEFIIAKQRNGPVDTARARFVRNLTLFEDLTDDDPRYGLSTEFDAPQDTGADDFPPWDQERTDHG